jgi:hypothetical protein
MTYQTNYPKVCPCCGGELEGQEEYSGGQIERLWLLCTKCDWTNDQAA